MPTEHEVLVNVCAMACGAKAAVLFWLAVVPLVDRDSARSILVVRRTGWPVTSSRQAAAALAWKTTAVPDAIMNGVGTETKTVQVTVFPARRELMSLRRWTVKDAVFPSWPPVRATGGAGAAPAGKAPAHIVVAAPIAAMSVISWRRGVSLFRSLTLLSFPCALTRTCRLRCRQCLPAGPGRMGPRTNHGSLRHDPRMGCRRARTASAS